MSPGVCCSGEWGSRSGGEVLLGRFANSEVRGGSDSGGEVRQVDSEGGTRGGVDQDSAPSQTGLGLLHPQEPGHDPGLCRGLALPSVRVWSGICCSLQSKEPQQSQNPGFQTKLCQGRSQSEQVLQKYFIFQAIVPAED